MSESKEKPKMIYRTLGNTGLKVSVLSFGSWATFGVKAEEDACRDCMRLAYESGVNFFDNAEAYGKTRGDSELLMGKLLKEFNWPRSSYVLSTKIFWGGDGVNEKGVSRKHLLEGVDNSLKRLQVDYVDLIFAHRPDVITPTEEVVRAMSHLVNTGKALYWGTSEWSAQQITEAHWIARAYNLVPPSMEQPEYHMFARERVEKEYAPIYKLPYGIGTTTWSPLASGILTGKYNDGIPTGSRLAQPGYEFLVQRFDKVKDDRIPKVKKLAELAQSLGCSLPQLAIAWCIRNPNVSTCILGASKVNQLQETLQALPVMDKITAEVDQQIEAILQNKPEAVMNWGRV